MYLNRITLIGFLGGDAEKKVSNATNIAVFSLATKTYWKTDAGTWESRTEWHRCVAFGKLADFAGMDSFPCKKHCKIGPTSNRILISVRKGFRGFIDGVSQKGWPFNVNHEKNLG